MGLAFDYNTQDTAGVNSTVDYIFGGHFLNWDFSFYPTGPYSDGYVPFDSDPYPQTIPGHSLAWWQANHPDWIVYQCDGVTPAYYGSGNSNVPLDFSNPEVRSWQLAQAGTMFSAGAKGIAFDDFTFANFANRCGVYKNGVWTKLGYPGSWQDNAKYDSDMMGWLQAIRAGLQEDYPGKTLTVNFASSVSGIANLQKIAPYIDMDFDEAGFTGYGKQRLSDAAWQHEVDALEYLNSRGKAFDINGIVGAQDDPSVSHDDINWVLANYLLVKGPHSYTYVYAGDGQGFTGSPSGYGTFYDRPEYHASIGSPTSARYGSQGLQMRAYSNGLVIVNPSSSQTYTVSLGETYHDLYGQSRSSVTLPPTSAAVLLGAPASTPTPPPSSPLAPSTTPTPGSSPPTASTARQQVQRALKHGFPVGFAHRRGYRVSCLRRSAVKLACRVAWNTVRYRFTGTALLSYTVVKGHGRLAVHLHVRRVRHHRA